MNLATVICAAALLFAATPSVQEDAAQAAAETWLKVVDEGNYDRSWDEASQAFKAVLPKEKWSAGVAAVRNPLGKVVTRKLRSRQATDTLPNAPAGKYVVIQYDTAFETTPQTLETIIQMLDPDGAWRPAGYFIRPQP
jgi:hypothetical protein